MKAELEQSIGQAVAEALELSERPDIELTRPDAQFGDYATNIALQLSKRLGQPPRAIAERLQTVLAEKLRANVREVSVAGPGFLNLRLTDQALWQALAAPASQPLKGQTIVAEYSDPNPFKQLHAGHLYTSVVGDAIANLLEQAGATVHRVNFGGDVGLHVAKNLWGILQYLGGELPDKLQAIEPAKRAAFLGDCYVQGNTAYETGAQAKDEIIELNKQVYAMHDKADHASPLAQIYWTCRQWSYDYFNAFYARIGSHFDKYYPESLTAPVGVAAVKQHAEVFTMSDGATVFDGEPYGLHTRVFLTSQGLPTYETKDMGASLMKYQDYHFDRSLIITGNDIVEYMKVVLKATEQFAPEVSRATRHITHGNLKLAGGVKMSSRLGNALLATEVLDATAGANQQLNGTASETTTLGAIKYAFLRQRLGGDIVYDPAESVSLEGNSGPYLQYAHARACSILAKVNDNAVAAKGEGELQAGERELVAELAEWNEVFDKAVTELLPHHVCGYLYELSQTFNRFYEHNKVLGDKRQALRLQLVRQYAATLKSGLELLGMHAPASLPSRLKADG